MCTRVFWPDNPAAMVVCRTLDAASPDTPEWVWRPAETPGRSHVPDTPESAPLAWTSRYANLTIRDFGDGILEGVNERGLAAHALMYTTAEYEPVDDRPTLGTSDWVTYVLDNFTCVADALTGLEAVRVTGAPVAGLLPGVHLVLEDATGESAIVEPTAGHMTVFRDPAYRVATNAPSFDTHLANLRHYRPFGGELPPPGDITALDRFVRASYYLHYLPEPSNAAAALAGVSQVVATTAKPPGAPYPSGEVYPTRWMAAIDLTNLVSYFWNRTSPAVVWADLPSLLQEQRPSGSLNLLTPELAGDVTALIR